MTPHYESNKSYILLTVQKNPIFLSTKAYFCVELIRDRGATGTKL